MRIKRKGDLEFFVGRRYGDFHRLHKRLRTELPGKVLPPMPRKNKQNSTATNLMYGLTGRIDDDDTSSISSMSTMPPIPQLQTPINNLTIKGGLQYIITKASPDLKSRSPSECLNNSRIIWKIISSAFGRNEKVRRWTDSTNPRN